MTYAVRRVGESITASAATVIVALLTLLAASFGLYHDLGVPLAIGIATMLAAGLTLLPALLAIFGRAVFWPTKTLPRDRSDGIWGRVAARLVRRPVWTLALGVVVLGVLALFALGFVPTGFGGDVAAPAGTSAARGNAALAVYFPQSSANPTNVVMHFPTSVWDNPQQLEVATTGLREPVLLHHYRTARPQRGDTHPHRAVIDLPASPPIWSRPGTGCRIPRASGRLARLGCRVHHLPHDCPLHQRRWAYGAMGNRSGRRQRRQQPRHSGRSQNPIGGGSRPPSRQEPTPVALPGRPRPSTT